MKTAISRILNPCVFWTVMAKNIGATVNNHAKNKILRTALMGIFLISAVGFWAWAATDEENEYRKKITDLERRAEQTGNPEFYKQAADFGFQTIIQDNKDPNVDPARAFPLGIDFFHETTNYVKYYETGIAQKEKVIASEPDPMVRFALLKDLLGFTFEGHRMFVSELLYPSLVPPLGGNGLRETFNLVNNCQAIMDGLKSQYDPFTCETSDVIKRNAVVANMFEVAFYCAKSMTSDLFDPALLPDIDWLNPYGVGAFCSHRVCGLLPPICEPDENQPSAPDSKPVEMPTSETDSSTKAIPVTTITETPLITPVAKVGTSCREEWDHCLQSARNVQEACNKDAYE